MSSGFKCINHSIGFYINIQMENYNKWRTNVTQLQKLAVYSRNHYTVFISISTSSS